MTHWDWSAITAVATVVSMVAYVLTAFYVRAELKSVDKDRYLTVTNDLFSVWQSVDFMDAQLWLLHRMEETTWESFVRAHRADKGEAAFHRVGGYYDRVGTLVRMGLVNSEEILSTIGAHAIAVWQKIEPLVREARRVENSSLFGDFERLLPACYECYVPNLGLSARVNPFSLQQPTADPAVGASSPGVSSPGVSSPAAENPAAGGVSGAAPESQLEASRISPDDLRKMLSRREPVTILDVRKESQFSRDHRTLPGAIRIPPEQIAQRYRKLPPGKPVVVYCA